MHPEGPQSPEGPMLPEGPTWPEGPMLPEGPTSPGPAACCARTAASAAACAASACKPSHKISWKSVEDHSRLQLTALGAGGAPAGAGPQNG